MRTWALIELAASMRLTLLLGLVASLFTPWGIATSLAGLPLALLAFAGQGGRARPWRWPPPRCCWPSCDCSGCRSCSPARFVLALLAATTSFFLA